jgi:hypothetical protein
MFGWSNLGPVENELQPRPDRGRRSMGVGTSDESCHLAVVVAQDSAEALATGETAFAAADVIGRLEDAVIKALMVPFPVIVLHVAMPKTACRGSSAIRGTPCFNSL